MTRSRLIATAVLGALALAALVPALALGSSNLRTFQSPSKNIGCVITRGKLGHEVRCDIRQHNWQAPPKPRSCHLDYGNGLVVGRKGKAKFVCAGDTVLGQGKVLAYGKAIQFGGFRCKSATSGMRCVDRKSQHGFKLSREQAKRF
jgi:hypothetical protein